MEFVDMFCGMGTIRMGFEQAGHKCVYSVEFDKHKREIYKVIFGSEPDAGDITTVRASDIPRSDCWCFGAPCQDFSIAGKRAGLDGSRSGLVKEVFRLLKEKAPTDRPEWLLYENVKGMLSSNNGWDFAAIQAEMGKLGYDVQWQLLNSKNFGVPQNRERVYTLGHLRARGSRQVFPIGSDCEPAAKLQGQCANTVTARYYGAQAVGTYCIESKQLSEIKQIGNLMSSQNNPQSGRIYDSNGISPTLDTCNGGNRMPKIAESCAVEGVNRGQKDQNGRRFKEPGEPMFTLTKQDIHGVTIPQGIYTQDSKDFHRPPLNGISRTLKANKYDAGIIQPNMRIRRLTPRECMRLQGVPDYITDKLIAAGISDTQMYRAAGDAVSVPVVYEIAKRM